MELFGQKIKDFEKNTLKKKYVLTCLRFNFIIVNVAKVPIQKLQSVISVPSFIFVYNTSNYFFRFAKKINNTNHIPRKKKHVNDIHICRSKKSFMSEGNYKCVMKLIILFSSGFISWICIASHWWENIQYRYDFCHRVFFTGILRSKLFYSMST